ncbi:MAG: hypothetical protein GY720_22025 [bacterium]|nr:hypothetical protein [bacterium]
MRGILLSQATVALTPLADRWIAVRSIAKPSSNTVAARRRDLEVIAEELAELFERHLMGGRQSRCVAVRESAESELAWAFDNRYAARIEKWLLVVLRAESLGRGSRPTLAVPATGKGK